VLVQGKPRAGVAGHGEGDTTGAVHLPEGLIGVPLCTTTPLRGRIPGSRSGWRWRCDAVSLAEGVVLGTAALVVELWSLVVSFGASSSGSFGAIVAVVPVAVVFSVKLRGRRWWLLPDSHVSVNPPGSWGNRFASRRYGALRSRARDKGSFLEAKSVVLWILLSGWSSRCLVPSCFLKTLLPLGVSLGVALWCRRLKLCVWFYPLFAWCRLFLLAGFKHVCICHCVILAG
jgi:hypothetical protein